MILWVYGILVKLRLIRIPVTQTYNALILGHTSADQVAKYMRPNQVEEFIALHEQVKTAVAGESHEFPDAVAIGLAQLLVSNPRRFHVVLYQIDSIIQRDLEKMVARQRGQNIVRREL